MFDSQFVYLLVLSAVEIFGDFSLDKYTKTNDVLDLEKGVAWYGAVLFFLIKSLKGSGILYVNGMWDGLSGLLEGVAAYVFLGQRFKRPMQYAGYLCICLGVLLLKE